MNKEYKELKKRYNYLSNKIKEGNAIGVVKRTSPDVFEEQNKIAIAMMTINSVY